MSDNLETQLEALKATRRLVEERRDAMGVLMTQITRNKREAFESASPDGAAQFDADGSVAAAQAEVLASLVPLLDAIDNEIAAVEDAIAFTS